MTLSGSLSCVLGASAACAESAVGSGEFAGMGGQGDRPGPCCLLAVLWHRLKLSPGTYTRVPGGGVCCGVQVCVGVYRPGTCAHSQVWALGHRCPLCPAPCRVSPPPMAHTETLKNDHSPSLQRSSAPLPGQRSLSFEEMLGGQVWTGMRLWHGQQGHGHPSVNPCNPHPQAPGTMPHTELKASLSGAGARHSRRGAVGGACT